jgi:hypothetical protein
MLARMEHEAVVQIGPGMRDIGASLEDAVIDPGSRQLARRCEARRTGTDDRDVV